MTSPAVAVESSSVSSTSEPPAADGAETVVVSEQVVSEIEGDMITQPDDRNDNDRIAADDEDEVDAADGCHGDEVQQQEQVETETERESPLGLLTTATVSDDDQTPASLSVVSVDTEPVDTEAAGSQPTLTPANDDELISIDTEAAAAVTMTTSTAVGDEVTDDNSSATATQQKPELKYQYSEG